MASSWGIILAPRIGFGDGGVDLADGGLGEVKAVFKDIGKHGLGRAARFGGESGQAVGLGFGDLKSHGHGGGSRLRLAES
jgi:hypothetical protein